jgi:hypothetical protein
VGGVETSGAVYVFLRDPASGQWLEHQHLLPANGNFGDRFSEMSLAIEGDTIVVGAPYTTHQDFQEGVVYVFERDRGGPGIWGEVARLSDVDVDNGGHFGSSVVLEGDLLVVGAPQDSSPRNGWVRIFERDRGGADNWGEVTRLGLTAVGDAGHPREFGMAVGIEDDLLVVGASRTSVSWFSQSDGAAYLFRRSATDPDRWDYVVRLIVPGADQCVGGLTLSQFFTQATAEEWAAADACARGNSTANEGFGHRVAIDGDTVVVTARFADAEDGTFSTGEAHVYRRDPGGADVWTHVATLAPSMPSGGGYFGSALALAGDTVLIGAPGTTIDARQRQGAAYLFERAAGGADAWGEVARLVASDGLSESQFGSAVALDGSARIIGAQGDSTYRGALYIQAPAAPEEPSEPTFEPTGELVDGGIVEDAAGVLPGAIPNTLPAPLAVWIHEVEAPAEPLPPEATALGAFYNVGAVETAIATSEGTFALALPVPEGADPAHIAAAVLAAADRQLEDEEPEHLWMPISGVYDPDQGLFSVALDVLERAGETFVLMEHRDVEPMASPAPAPAARTATEAEFQFEVQCYGFKDDAECSAEDEDKFELYLQEAYARFIAAGYDKPRLSNKIVTIRTAGDGSKQVEKTESLLYHGNKISDPNGKMCTRVGAGSGVDFYEAKRSGKSTMVFCFSGTPDPDNPVPITDADRRMSAAHELFHAFQYGIPAMFKGALAGDKAERLWISEGTASAAASDATTVTAMARSWSSLRPINIGLTAHDIESALDGRPPEEEDDLIAFAIAEYLVEDFWVYFGLRENLGLGYLKPLFELGGSTLEAADFFFRGYDTTLAAEYWRWVKNQAMEKTVFFAEVPQEPCRIQMDAVGEPEVLWYPRIDAPNFAQGTLPPLTSEVIEITAINREGLGPTRVFADEAQGLRYKIYLEEEDNCAEVVDGERTFPSLPFGTVLYAVVANTRYWDRLSYTVRIEGASP